VNQAVGILIARGWTLDDAREELRRRAFHDGVPSLRAAHY
jgi:hypothetical protein